MGGYRSRKVRAGGYRSREVGAGVGGYRWREVGVEMEEMGEKGRKGEKKRGDKRGGRGRGGEGRGGEGEGNGQRYERVRETIYAYTERQWRVMHNYIVGHDKRAK